MVNVATIDQIIDIVGGEESRDGADCAIGGTQMTRAEQWDAAFAEALKAIPRGERRVETILSHAEIFLDTPRGGWPETQQAWRRLEGECYGSDKFRDAALEIAGKYLTKGHPSRW